jgi:predicted CopG family antitoxin
MTYRNRNTNLLNDEKELTSQQLTTIAISKENYYILKRMGFAGDSFNDVLGRVLKGKNKLLLESHSQVGEPKRTLTDSHYY